MIFTSDNGGERYSYNWPFSFQKMYLYEGGTRVPAIVRWPGVDSRGARHRAGGDHDGLDRDDPRRDRQRQPDPAYPLDGENLMPVCTGERAVYDRTLFWRTVERAAARVGSWKYLADKDGEYLFDLSVDPGEKDDRRRSEPDTVRADQAAVPRLERADAAAAAKPR